MEAMCCSVHYKPLAETCTFGGHRLPRILFFGLSGGLCDIAGLGANRLLVLFLPSAISVGRESFAWTLSYTLSIALRHGSHGVLVFGWTNEPVWLALGRTYLAYLSTIIASIVMSILLQTLDVFPSAVALLITASFSGLWAYFALKAMRAKASDTIEYQLVRCVQHC